MTHLTYPNESAEYRAARNALLAEETALREHIEAVAARRRALPPGGTVPEDYVFERIGKNDMPESVRMSSLFGQHRTLILYSFMYGPERDTPCPMCTLALARLRQRRGRAYRPARIALRRREITDRAPSRMGARSRMVTPAVRIDRGQPL